METESYSGEEEVEDDQDYTNPALKKRRDATAIDALPPAPETPPPTIPVHLYFFICNFSSW